MADEKLKAKLGLDNSEFKRGLKDSENQLGKMSAGMKRLGVVLGAVFSVSAVTNFAKKSALAYDEEIKASQSLLVALKGRRDIQESLIDQAVELQKKTLFADDQTIMAASRMAMVIGDNEVAIKRLIPLVQDLAQAKFEGNLVTAADLVAKSIGSGTNALARYGIEIKGAIGSAERLESALEGLNKQVGGQAEAAAKVGLGPVTILKNAWGDLTEQIGKAIIESKAFNKIIETLKKAVDALSKDNIAVNDPFALWRDIDKQTAENLKRQVLEQIKYFESIENGQASLQFWKEGLEVLDGIINATTPDITIQAEEIENLGDTAEEAAKKLEKLKKANELFNLENFGGSYSIAGAVAKEEAPIGTGWLGEGKTLADAPQYIQPIKDMTNALMLQNEAINILTNGFDTLFSSAGEGFKGMIDTMIDGMKRLVAEYLAKAAIFGLIMALFPATGAAKFAQKSLWSMFGINGFATGGMVFGPQLAMVGENSSRSNPEVIAPLNKLMGMMGPQIVEVKGTIKGKDIALALRRNG